VLSKTFRWSVIVVFSAITLIPMLWLVMSSFKTDAELFASPWALPESWSFRNYTDALAAHPMLTFLRNSVLVSVISTGLILVAALMASYAMLHRFRFSKTTFGFLLFGILLPVNALMTPIFFIVNMMGLYNNILGLALVYAGLFFPLGFLVVKAYMDTTPTEILEAARVDGASFHAIFRRIVVPLTSPGAVTAGIFLMITTWNELLFASILTQDTSSQTVQVGIRFFLTTYAANYPQAFAATVIAIAPTVVVYMLLSERIVDAMTAGSLK
jgi:raffinose/stachyose/melibiose transport system permease protein